MLGHDIPSLLHRYGTEAEKILASWGFPHRTQKFSILARDGVYDLFSQGGGAIDEKYRFWLWGKSFDKFTAMERKMPLPVFIAYEFVGNTDPCLAFIRDDISAAAQILIVFHVYGHNLFFSLHPVFANPKPLDYAKLQEQSDMAIIKEYMADPNIGKQKVVRLLEACQWIMFQHTALSSASFLWLEDFADPAFNPRLEDWERAILRIKVDEARRAIPAMSVQVANEGFACAVEDELASAIVVPPELHHSIRLFHEQQVSPSPDPRTQCTPYQLGYTIIQELKQRHGFHALPRLLKNIADDNTLINMHFTPQIAARLNLVLPEYDAKGNIKHDAIGKPIIHYPEESSEVFEQIKQRTLQQLLLNAYPQIAFEKVEGDRLFLLHHYDGRPLKIGSARRVTEQVAEFIWKGPITLNARTTKKRYTIEVTPHGTSKITDRKDVSPGQ
jgi:stage V sporulation protein R